MKTIRLSAFVILNLLVLNVSVSPLFAKAPTTTKILFTSTRDGNRDVYIMNPDGSEQVNLTRHRAEDMYPVWSPTGEQILFVSDRRGVRDLYLMDPDGTNVRHIFKKKIEARRERPTWSPDGKQIAYMHVDWNKGTAGMYIATLGRQEEEHVESCWSPAWAPDGTEIACDVSDPARTWIIFINVRTRKQEHLLSKKVLPWQQDPSWSARGDRLAFSGNNNPLPVILDRDLHNAWKAKQTIFIVNRDGTELQQLVDEAGFYAQYPALSPDGEQVLYTQKIKNDFQIFKLGVNTGIRTQLTHIDWNTGGDWFDPAYALPVSPQPYLLSMVWGKVKER